MTICTIVAAPAVQPSPDWLGVRIAIMARAGALHGHPVVALHQPEQVLDATLLDIERVDMAEVVTEDLDRGRPVQDQRPRGPPSRDLRDLLGLVPLQLDLESCHVTIRSSPAGLPCPTSPYPNPPGPGWVDPTDIIGPMDISTHLDFAAEPEAVFAMMTDQASPRRGVRGQRVDQL